MLYSLAVEATSVDHTTYNAPGTPMTLLLQDASLF